jgi:hypothetical protein
VAELLHKEGIVAARGLDLSLDLSLRQTPVKDCLAESNRSGRASGLTRQCPVLAHMRQTNSANVGPVLGRFRTFVRRPATSQFDPEETQAWSNSNELSVGSVKPLVLEESLKSGFLTAYPLTRVPLDEPCQGLGWKATAAASLFSETFTW